MDTCGNRSTKARVSYDPNTFRRWLSVPGESMEGGFTSYTERIDAKKVRARSESFLDHFSQARLFYISQSEPEQNHIVDALRFELGKVETEARESTDSWIAYPNR